MGDMYDCAHMKKTYKFRLYPTGKQISVLDGQVILCQQLYNTCLEQRISRFKQGDPTNYYEQKRGLVELKKEFPEYKDIYSHALQDVVKRLDEAYKHFFRRVKKGGEKPGFPHFKSRWQYTSITFDRYGFKVRADGRLNLTRVGDIRMFNHREIEGVVKVCTIKRDKVGDWWATITTEVPDIAKVIPKTAIGVDVGLTDLATLSTGEIIQRERFYKKLSVKEKKLQRKIAKQKKGGQNRQTTVKKLAKVHRDIQRQRDDYLHKVSKEIIDKADVIVFENLNIPNMMKTHRLAQNIADASWGKLIQYTQYNAEKLGKHVVLVDPRGTTQLCSQCGELVPKSLSERLHMCTNCGFSTSRDWNAALNILGRLPRGTGELLKTSVEAKPLPVTQGAGKYG